MDVSGLLRRAVASPRQLAPKEIEFFLSSDSPAVEERLFAAAREVKARCGKSEVLPRALIETSNVCSKDCLYCGIRKGNSELERYRMNEREVCVAVDEAAGQGFKAVAFQSGEIESEENTSFFERVIAHSAAAGLEVTLSLGEQEPDVYRRWKAAMGDGVLRYLIRIETSNRRLYESIHPAECSFDRRLESIRTLKRLGFVTGSGVMIGLPGQSFSDLARDIVFYGDERLDMVGMGPYIPTPGTPLSCRARNARLVSGDSEVLRLSLRMIALARLYLHDVNIVAATALEALDPIRGRELGIAAGANVVMPKFTPGRYREAYALYPSRSSSVTDPLA